MDKRVTSDSNNSRLNKEFNYWFNHQNQKKLQYELAVIIFQTEDLDWSECISKAREMLDVFYKDVLNPTTRKW